MNQEEVYIDHLLVDVKKIFTSVLPELYSKIYQDWNGDLPDDVKIAMEKIGQDLLLNFEEKHGYRN